MSTSRIPRFSPDQAGEIVRDLYGIETQARQLVSYQDQNFLLEHTSGRRLVLKIANGGVSREALDLQNRAMEHVAAREPELGTPGVCSTLDGERVTEIPGAEDETGAVTSHRVRLLTFLDGAPWSENVPHSLALGHRLGRYLGALDRGLADFSHPDMHRHQDWDPKHFLALRRHVKELGSRELQEQAAPVFDRFERYVAPCWSGLRASVIHGDANDHNLLVDEGGGEIAGIIDFGDVMHTATVCEIAIAMAYAMFGHEEPLAMGCEILRGYHEVHPLEAVELEVLGDLILSRLITSLVLSARSRRLDPDNAYLSSSKQGASRLLEQLTQQDPAKIRQELVEACGRTVSVVRDGRSSEEILAARQRHLGGSLSISYGERPLKIVRGAGPYLIDDRGRAYLDAINNVNHVGHNHPQVVAAAHRQMKVLNTNTRYLHDNLVEYTERLAATMPDPLSVCYIVNSGSEANDLALRLARTHTGHRDAVVVDGAYHGTTISVIELSSYKFDGPGGSGRARHVHMVPTPDVYRGPHKGDDPESGAKYARDVRRAIERAHGDGRQIAAYFCESMLSCGGQVILPTGYLHDVFRYVHDAGGVCIADEVQVGFGRPGTTFWAYETQGVVPDIVTLGKPIGNGHPMSAVITTPEIAESFDNGMEYFNTFGGNPVSCAVGLAVLDVVEEEGLQEQARIVGEYLLAELGELAARHPLIGDVRGHGMFLGIELVRDRESLEPATAEATAIIGEAKERGVLLSTEGPLHNVIKIKPPLVWTKAHADILVEVLDAVLAEGVGRG